MGVMSNPFDFDRYDRIRPIRWDGDALELLDQRLLPASVAYQRCNPFTDRARRARDRDCRRLGRGAGRA